MNTGRDLVPIKDTEMVLRSLTEKHIQQYFCPKATVAEAGLFLGVCRSAKLNPFLQEAYLVKYAENQPAAIIVGKNAYLNKAQEYPAYDGFEAGIIVERDGNQEEREGTLISVNEKLIGGWAKVYRKDRRVPFAQQVTFEHVNKGQSLWKTEPEMMVRKVALKRALQEAFPDLGRLSQYQEQEEYEGAVPPAPSIESIGLVDVTAIEAAESPSPEPQPQREEAAPSSEDDGRIADIIAGFAGATTLQELEEIARQAPARLFEKARASYNQHWDRLASGRTQAEVAP